MKKKTAAAAATQKIADAAATTGDLIARLGPVIKEASDVVVELNHVISEIEKHDLDLDDVLGLLEQGWELGTAIAIAVAGQDVRLGGSGNTRARIRALSRWWASQLAARQAAIQAAAANANAPT